MIKRSTLTFVFVVNFFCIVMTQAMDPVITKNSAKNDKPTFKYTIMPLKDDNAPVGFNMPLTIIPFIKRLREPMGFYNPSEPFIPCILIPIPEETEKYLEAMKKTLDNDEGFMRNFSQEEKKGARDLSSRLDTKKGIPSFLAISMLQKAKSGDVIMGEFKISEDFYKHYNKLVDEYRDNPLPWAGATGVDEFDQEFIAQRTATLGDGTQTLGGVFVYDPNKSR